MRLAEERHVHTGARRSGAEGRRVGGERALQRGGRFMTVRERRGPLLSGELCASYEESGAPPPWRAL